jgi:hypothetical protein
MTDAGLGWRAYLAIVTYLTEQGQCRVNGAAETIRRPQTWKVGTWSGVSRGAIVMGHYYYHIRSLPYTYFRLPCTEPTGLTRG